MRYKGYTGMAEVDDEAGLIFGRVIGLRGVITFQGATVAEARKSFEESVDFYLEMCAASGAPPEKPFSGRFLVRINPALHRTLAQAAAVRGSSLNAVVEQALREAFPPGATPRAGKPRRAKAVAGPKTATTTTAEAKARKRTASPKPAAPGKAG
jgi:predicted HicB family RNase H-like nuclease